MSGNPSQPVVELCHRRQNRSAAPQQAFVEDILWAFYLLPAEQAQAEIEEKLFDYVYSMKKSKLQETLITLLVEGPDWQYDRFVETYLDLDDED